ncbi:MAG: hypothetical protein IKN65_01650 [Clostridia bacterium]|nr:hypothetical protein [Clostridia bacterium]
MGKHKKTNKDNTRGFLKALIALMLVAVIVILGYTGKIYIDEKKLANSNPIQNSQNNTINNSSNENKEENENNQTSEDENKSEEEEKTVEEEPEEEPTQEETSVNDEDKAIDLAKKQFGTSDGVYYRIEQIQSNGVYIVSVRDNETTRDLAWYTVDVKNGTVK